MNLSKIVVMTTILGVFGLFSANFATPVSALSLTLSVPSDPLSLEIQPLSMFTKSSPSSVSVKTDAFAGYSLSIKAQTNNELVNGTSKLTSISQNLSEEQYQGAGNLNTWGYKPSKFNSLDNTLFLPGPTTAPAVIETTKAANNSAATSYEFLLAAKVDATIAHGVYKNIFVFSATANTVSYNIKYELNSGSWSGASPQTGNTAESTVALDSHTPSRSGYEFKGWCPQSTSNEACGTTSYQPGNSYPLKNGDNTVTLWAMWLKLGPKEIDSCNEATTYSEIYLLENKKIRKLKDDKCWMIEDEATGVSVEYASNYCRGIWMLPSRDNFFNLAGKYGMSYTLSSSGGSCYHYVLMQGNANTLLKELSLENSSSYILTSDTGYNKGYCYGGMNSNLNDFNMWWAGGTTGTIRCVSG